ncbi:MAG: hypothetical protein V7L20_20015 [Nostoc sp.]
MNSDSLRTLCLDAGADDVGFVEIYRPRSPTNMPKFWQYFHPPKH